MWLIVLSDQLRIVALVSRYLTNKLIRRGLVPDRRPKLPFSGRPEGQTGYPVLIQVSLGYPGVGG